MKNRVRIDVTKLAKPMRELVVAKAARFCSTIVYRQGNILIEENPLTTEKRTIQPRFKAQ